MPRGDHRKGPGTRQVILAAAISRFGRDGYRSTSVADIAREAAVGPTAAFAYFPNKEALFLAAVDADAAAMIEEALSKANATSNTREWRQAFFVGSVEALGRHSLAPSTACRPGTGLHWPGPGRPGTHRAAQGIGRPAAHRSTRRSGPP